jgi:hypothetical protein
MHRRQERRRRGNTDVLVALSAGVAFIVVIFLLTKAAVPIITALSVVSFNEPRVYAALLALMVGLPGLLFTLPRATKGPEPYIPPSVHRRRERPRKRDSFLLTDAVGLVALLAAQVPIPAPWGAQGKAATVANVTMSAEIVELSWAFAWPSLVVSVVGIVAAVIAHVYRHAPGLRVISIILAVGAPALAWFYLTRTVLA